MAEMLAVSEARRGVVLYLTPDNLEPVGFIRCGRSPGRLVCCGDTFCADRAEQAVYRFCRGAEQAACAFRTAPETEALCVCRERLFALSGAASALQAFSLQTSALIGSASVGVCPRGLCLLPDQRTLAIAGGADGRVWLLDAETLALHGGWRTCGDVCAVALYAGFLYALCAEGEYDLRSIVGLIDERGAFHPQIALPGFPGAMAACGGGLLVGHAGCLTMLDAPNCRIRWQTKMRGIPTQIVPMNRLAAFADETDGLVGLVELRQGNIRRRAQCDCPSGLAVV